MSSIKAPIVALLRTEDYHLLPRAADQAAAALGGVKGLTSVNTIWGNDFTEARLNIDTNRALAYGVTPVQVAAQFPLSGVPVAISGNLVSLQNQFVRLYFNRPFDGNLDQLRLIPIQTPKGPVPLSALAKIDYGLTVNKIERNQMLYALDVSGYRNRRAISTLSKKS